MEVEDMFVGAGFGSSTVAMRMLTQHVHAVLPRPPVDACAPLFFAAAASAPDGVDRISRLPESILRNIVSRLPAKDAARTIVLSRRWRLVWSSVPLVLVDAHLLAPAVFRRYCDYDLVAGVSDALSSHPGPFGCVYLTRTTMEDYRGEVAPWIQLLATKGVQDLVFVNRARRLRSDLELPPSILECPQLIRLYLGFWRFPEMAATAAAFPRLLELGLCALVMTDRDLALLLERCPCLKKLLVIANRSPVCIRISNPMLECIELCTAIVPEIALKEAPMLRRLLIWHPCGGEGLTYMSQAIRIDVSPNLHTLGFLVPGMHLLHIGGTAIKFETQPSQQTTIPSVKMLAVQVKLGTRKEARMLPSFLRCFPNVKTLYIQSEIDDEPKPGVKFGSKFWKEAAGPIQCIQQSITKVVFRGFRGKRSEVDFLRFVAKRAQSLEKLDVFLAPGPGPMDGMILKVRDVVTSATWASYTAVLTCYLSPFQDEGTPWCFRRASDLSVDDPFDVTKCLAGKCCEK